MDRQGGNPPKLAGPVRVAMLSAQDPRGREERETGALVRVHSATLATGPALVGQFYLSATDRPSWGRCGVGVFKVEAWKPAA